MSKKLGKLIKDARTEKGLTQASLAEFAGISASEIGKIERGEKEPSQDTLKKMAKPLGLTQKALLEAAAGAGTTSGTTGSSGKTSGTAASSGKTGSAKTSSKKTSSAAKAAVSVTSLTATEKKLVQYYRKADSNTKKAAMNLLSGEGNAVEILSSLVLSKNTGKILGSKEVSTMASGLFDTLLSGKTSGKNNEEG